LLKIPVIRYSFTTLEILVGFNQLIFLPKYELGCSTEVIKDNTSTRRIFLF
jgi:hypothetical protein